VKKPEVTVVIPTRDRWALISRTALPAALGQKEVDLEVVVVDEASIDATPERLASYRDPRVRMVRHERPLGVAAARNAGIAAADGKWIAFLDDDDVWSPRKLRVQLDAAAAAGAGFSYAGAVWIDGEFEFVHGHTPPRPETLASSLLRWNVIWGGGSNVVACTDVLRRLGGFDDSLFQLADWDLWIRLAQTARAAAVDTVLVGLLVHRDSMLLVDRRDVFLEFERLSAKHGGLPDRARFARWVAAGHLRAGRRVEAARTYVRGTRAPGNVIRAASVLLGPRAMRAAGRARALIPGALASGERTASRPDWLDLYR
jgi:glycosyltransferase involved in cell wall biosynthesis